MIPFFKNNFPDVQEIAHALSTQKLSSDQNYKADYEKTMVGKGPVDAAKSYPEYDHLRKVSKQSSAVSTVPCLSV